MSAGRGGRNIITKRNPEIKRFTGVYGPGLSFHILAMYPGRICMQVSLIGHDAQKNRVNSTPTIATKKRYPPAMKSEFRYSAYTPVNIAIIPNIRPTIPNIFFFISKYGNRKSINIHPKSQDRLRGIFFWGYCGLKIRK